MENPENQIQTAISRNEFVSLLMGENGYKHEHPLIEIPTDVGLMFIAGCNNFILKEKENIHKLKAAFDNAFNELLKTPSGTWWTLYIINDYLFAYLPGSLQFEIDVLAHIRKINNSIKKFEYDLRNSNEWVGYRFENGLWDDVVRMARQINEYLRSINSQILLDEF